MSKSQKLVGALCLLLMWMPVLASGQSNQINGTVKDAETGLPLQRANVVLLGTKIGSMTNSHGEYRLSNVPPGKYTIRVSYIGYEAKQKEIDLEQEQITVNFDLDATVLRGREVIITATRAIEGETPVAFSTLKKEDIKIRYFAQDLPVMLSELPSTTFYSESGNGIGYNYLSIRGFDQRRISVMINGIPQNDPEDHNIYWLDFPDFLGNVEDIQVQRGAGSAFYGPPAIGGSLNILTSRFDTEKKISLYTGGGSYGTRKYSAALNSGLLDNQFILFGRVSQIKSDGYRDQSWVDFKSYFFGAARFTKKSSLRLHIYGGPIEDHLAYYGISKEAALSEESNIRKQNPIQRPDEIENFNQPHAELIHRYQISNKLFLNNTLFAIHGYGFFDYDGSWAPMSYFRVTPQYGFDIQDDPENVYVNSLLIRAYVDNRQVGWLPNLTWKLKNANIVVGSEIRLHRSLHWGRIQDGSDDLPLAVSGMYQGHDYIGTRRYYEYKGAKDIISPYLHTGYNVNNQLNLMFDLQFSYKRYHLYDEKFNYTDFDINYYFLNPRLGINYKLDDATNIFTSVSRTNREPRLKTLYDAAEASTPASWGAVVPQFEQTANGTYDFDNPLVKPEALNDFEVGLSHRTFSYFANINLFYMDFKNEIVKSGQLDRFGQPVTGNAERTLHRGIEVSGGLNITPYLIVSGNFTFSKNELTKYRDYSDGGELKILDGNPIAGFPNILANARMTYRKNNFVASVTMQHVGKEYTDNFENEQNTVDRYTIFNGIIGYNFGRLLGIKGFQLQLHARNILNKIYIMHGEGSDFFPGAERQLFLSSNIEL